jgi:hypothetical protein
MWIFFFILFIAFCWTYYQLSLIKAAIINVRKAWNKQEELQPKSVEVLIGLFGFIACAFIALLPWFD